MDFSFGKHENKSVIEVMIKDPSYIVWIMNQSNKSNFHEKVTLFAAHRIEVFNKIPFQKKCNFGGCENTIDCCVLLKAESHWLCDTCLQSMRDEFGRYSAVNTYLGAVNYVTCLFDSPKARGENSMLLVRELARAKGLPKRATLFDISNFFNYVEPVKPKLHEKFFADD